jgi:hypothetical protein
MIGVRKQKKSRMKKKREYQKKKTMRLAEKKPPTLKHPAIFVANEDTSNGELSKKLFTDCTIT